MHRYAKTVMGLIGGVDIERSLAFLEVYGGGCAWEVLFNIDPDRGG
jgi:hypothetical protein